MHWKDIKIGRHWELWDATSKIKFADVKYINKQYVITSMLWIGPRYLLCNEITWGEKAERYIVKVLNELAAQIIT